MWSAFTRAPPPATASLRSPKVAADDNNNDNNNNSGEKHHNPPSTATTVSSSSSSTLPARNPSMAAIIMAAAPTPKARNQNKQPPKDEQQQPTNDNIDNHRKDPKRRSTMQQLDEEDENHVTRLMEKLAFACSPTTSPCKVGGESDGKEGGNVEVLLASLDRQFRRLEGDDSHDDDDEENDDDDDEIRELSSSKTINDNIDNDLVGRIGDFVSESLASMLEQTQLTIDEADRQLTKDEGDYDDDEYGDGYQDGCYILNNDDASTVHPDLATTTTVLATPPRHPLSSSQQQQLKHYDPAMWTMQSPLAHTPAVVMIEDEEDLQLKEQLLAKFSRSEAMDELPHPLQQLQQQQVNSSSHDSLDQNHYNDNNENANDHDDNEEEDANTTKSMDHQTSQLLAHGWVLSPVSSDLTPATMNRPPDPPALHIQQQHGLSHVQESTSETYNDDDNDDDDDDDDEEEETLVEFYDTHTQNDDVVSTEEGPGFKKIMYHIVTKDGEEQTVVVEEEYEGEEAILMGTESEHQDDDDDEEMETQDELDNANDIEEKYTEETDDYTTNTYHPFVSGDTSVGVTTTATPTLPLLQHLDEGAFSPQPPATTSEAAAAAERVDDDSELPYISRPLATDLTDLETDLHNEKLDRYTMVGEIANDNDVTSPTNAEQLLQYETEEEEDGRALTTTASSATEPDLRMTDSLDSWLNQMKSKSYATEDDESARDSPRKRPIAAHDYGDATPILEEEGEDDKPKGTDRSTGTRGRSAAASVRSTKSFATFATNRSTIARSVKTVPHLKLSPPATKRQNSASTSRPSVSATVGTKSNTRITTNTLVNKSSAVINKQVAPITRRSVARSGSSSLAKQTPKTPNVTTTSSKYSTAGARSPTKPFPGGVAPTNLVRKSIRPLARPESNILPRRPRTVTIEVSNRLLVGTAASRAQKVLLETKSEQMQAVKARAALNASVTTKSKTPIVRKSNVCGVGANTSRLLQQQAAARGDTYRPPTPTLAPTTSTDSSQKNLRVIAATPVSSRLLRPTAASLAQRIVADNISPTASSASRGTMSSMDSYGFSARKYAPPTTIVKPTAMRRMAEAAPPRPTSRPKPRVVTTPKSPFFATNAKYGSGSSSSNTHKPRPDAPTLAQSHHVLQKCLRDISPSDSFARSHTLTVPKSPNLHTTSRIRDRHVVDLTQLHSRGSKDQDDIPMANSTDFLMRGLRDGAPAVSMPIKRDGKLTIPVTPKFHSIHKRAAIKSHDDSDKDIMEYNNLHPFKALPMPSSSAAASESNPHIPNPVPNKPHRPTEPIPFHFHTADRHRTPKPEEPNNQRSSSNSRARPTPEAARPVRTIPPTAPTLATSARSASREAAREASERRAEELMRERQQLATKRQRERHLGEMAKATEALSSRVKTTTAMQPFSFHSDRPKSGESARELSERRAEELRKEKQLLAAKRQRERHLEALAKASGDTFGGASVASSCAPSKTIVQPFTFHNRPSSSYQALKEASERRAEALMREKQFLAAKRAKEKHLEEMKALRVNSSPLKTKVEPFALQTDQRHAKYEKLMLETKRRQEEEEERRTKFRARPCPETTFREAGPNAASTAEASAAHHAHRPTTTPEPFHLKSVSRHEAYQQELQKKIKQDEENLEQEEARMRKSYKALPVPKSTYVSPPPTLHHHRRQGHTAEHDSPESFQWESLPPEDSEQEQATIESSEYGVPDDMKNIIIFTNNDDDNNKARSSNYASPPMPGGGGGSMSRSSQNSQSGSSSWMGQEQRQHS